MSTPEIERYRGALLKVVEADSPEARDELRESVRAVTVSRNSRGTGVDVIAADLQRWSNEVLATAATTAKGGVFTQEILDRVAAWALETRRLNQMDDPAEKLKWIERRPVRREFSDDHGLIWLVYELPAGERGRLDFTRSLVFERPGIVRRIHNYPENWATLDEHALRELCETC
jgi:hypothetical protein